MFCFIAYFSGRLPSSTGYFFVFLLLLSELVLSDLLSDPPLSFLKTLLPLLNRPFTLSPTFLAGFFDSTFSEAVPLMPEPVSSFVLTTSVACYSVSLGVIQ